MILYKCNFKGGGGGGGGISECNTHVFQLFGLLCKCSNLYLSFPPIPLQVLCMKDFTVKGPEVSMRFTVVHGRKINADPLPITWGK